MEGVDRKGGEEDLEGRVGRKKGTNKDEKEREEG